MGSRPTASHFLCQQLSFRVLLTPLTYIHVGNKETNERKSRLVHCTLWVPIIYVVDKAVTKLTKNVQTVVTENPLSTT